MRHSIFLFAGLGLLFATACNSSQEANAGDTVITADTTMASPAVVLPYKISLAQWSLNRRYRADDGKPYEFAADAKGLGFAGIEYVSQLYAKDLEPKDGNPAQHRAKAMAVMTRLDSIADAVGIQQVLIMLDNEGDLSSTDEKVRMRAIQNHKDWIDAASSVGIPTVRLNAGGDGPRKQMHDVSVKSLTELGAYAKTKNVNVDVENHGGNSSDPNFLAGVMAAVGMDNVGILPDFGNWCRMQNDAATGGCKDEVPTDSIYYAVGMWMPYAHAVSAKSHNFGPDGLETRIDYGRMMDTVVAHGYTGFVGIEFEGEGPELEGIKATKALLERRGR